MPRFSDAARQKLIDSGRKKGYGDITSREMGAMGGTTTRNLVQVAKAALGGDPDSIANVENDQVYVKKTNDAGPLDLDLPAGSELADAGAAPEAQTRRGAGARSRQHA